MQINRQTTVIRWYLKNYIVTRAYVIAHAAYEFAVCLQLVSCSWHFSYSFWNKNLKIQAKNVLFCPTVNYRHTIHMHCMPPPQLLTAASSHNNNVFLLNEIILSMDYTESPGRMRFMSNISMECCIDLLLYLPLRFAVWCILFKESFIMPRPYGRDIKRCYASDVCLSVCLTSVCLSRTSGLSREKRGLGRLKLAQR